MILSALPTVNEKCRLLPNVNKWDGAKDLLSQPFLAL